MAYVEDLEKTKPAKCAACQSDQEVIDALRKSLKTTIITNVLEEEDFKTQVYGVFEKMANILSRTLGPYGGTTMIDQGTNYSTTKDGFHVLQNLRFADTKQNRIKSTLFSISHQMVTKVGDGSTSAVVAAFNFFKEMLDFSKDMNIRPKELNENVQIIVNKACDIIAKNAITVTDDNLIDVVQRISSIATNENKVYTDIICDIYKALGSNCSITISESETMEDQIEYEDGVYSADYYLLDRIYHNKNNVCVTDDCAFLLFDHTLDSDAWDFFVTAFNNFCYRTRKTLVIISPFYEQYLLDKIRRDAEEAVRLYSGSAKIPFRMIFLKSTLTKPIQKEMHKDLAALLGCTILQPVDTREWYGKFKAYQKACQEAISKGEGKGPEFPQELIDMIGDHIGYCSQAIMGDKVSSFKGFTNRNEAIFNTLYHDAEESMKIEQARVLKNDAIDNKLIDARNRFIKINCKSANIKVGGSNKLEMSMNYDAVDDAVKATASAIKYGYNAGCNMAIIKALDYLFDSEFDTLTDTQKTIIKTLKQAFVGVYRTILNNGYSQGKVDAIIAKSLVGYQCYDMVHDEFDTSNRIINSCRTDIEILRGAIAMVAVVMSCNQYISTTLNN